MPTLVEPLKSSPFVTIKRGSQDPPIFIVHGLCGRTQFSKLVKYIRTTNSVYGIQAKGVDGAEQPFDRIEDMSKFYLEGLQNSYSDGPYILIGYSFGGLIALEMARCLLESGASAPLLILVDSYPHPRFLTSIQRQKLFLRALKGHIDEMRRLSGPEAFSYFLQRIKNRLRIPSILSKSVLEAQREGIPAIELVKSKAYEALANYQPRFYPGKINFVTTDKKSFFPDPETVWAHLADKLEVDIIPGDHLSIVTSEFEALAAVITRLIRKLDLQPPPQARRSQGISRSSF